MRVPLAFLADYAAIQEDGNKLHVLGGGIDTLKASTFPLVQPNLALVMKLSFDEPEWGAVHVLHVQAIDHDGHELQAQRALSVVPRPPADVVVSTEASPSNQLAVSLPIVHNMRDVEFARPGRYEFKVTLANGTVAVSLHLQVSGSTDDASLDGLLNSGYQAFVSGDLDRAWSSFDEAIRVAPGSAAAHNDYGFLNLSRGHAEKALSLFETARDLGYEFRELVDANIACCHYLLGRNQEAFAEFRRLMGSDLQNSPSVLFALNSEGISPVELDVAVHFISLMALNAGYAALAEGSLPDAEQFAQIAAAGRITFTNEKNSTVFVSALDHLIDETKKRSSATSSGNK